MIPGYIPSFENLPKHVLCHDVRTTQTIYQSHIRSNQNFIIDINFNDYFQFGIFNPECRSFHSSVLIYFNPFVGIKMLSFLNYFFQINS